MLEAMESFQREVERPSESPSDQLRKIAKQIAVFHIEGCKDALLDKALKVVKAVVDYADELEK